MKRIVFALLLALVIVGIGSVTVHALDLGGGLLGNAGKAAQYDPATETTFAEKLGQVIQIGLSFIGIIFLMLTFYAGFRWMTARGDTEAIDKAKETLRGSVIGIVITVGAYSIAAFVVPAILSEPSGPLDAPGPPSGDTTLTSCCIKCPSGVSGVTSFECFGDDPILTAGVTKAQCPEDCGGGAHCEFVETVPASKCQ